MSSRIRTQSYASRTERELRESNASLLDSVNTLSDKTWRRDNAIVVLSIALVILAVVFICTMSAKNFELDVEHEQNYRYELSIRQMENQIRYLNDENAMLRGEPARVSLGQAFANCLDVVSASMEDVVVDADGIPLKVNRFADDTCRSELDAAGENGFIGKFSQQG